MLCPVTSDSGYNRTISPQTVLEVCAQLPKTVPGTVVTAIVAAVVLVLVKLLNEKLHRRLPLPIPGELLTVRMPGDGWTGEGTSEGRPGQYTTSGYLRAAARVLGETGRESPLLTFHHT